MSTKCFELDGGVWNLCRCVLGLKLDHQWPNSKFGRVSNQFRTHKWKEKTQFKIRIMSSKFTWNFDLAHRPPKNSMFLGSNCMPLA